MITFLNQGRFGAPVLAAVLMLAGCARSVRYAYHPPASAEGRVCISQCANARQQCRYLLEAG